MVFETMEKDLDRIANNYYYSGFYSSGYSYIGKEVLYEDKYIEYNFTHYQGRLSLIINKITHHFTDNFVIIMDKTDNSLTVLNRDEDKETVFIMLYVELSDIKDVMIL